jgi:hypothetical protein
MDQKAIDDLKARMGALSLEARNKAYTLQRKLSRMTVQRDEWKARAQKYRKQVLEKNT